MRKLKKLKRLMLIIAFSFINLTCFDMYNDIWDNGSSDKYKLAVFRTTTAATSTLLVAESGGSVYQLSAPVLPTTGYSTAMADFDKDGNIDILSISFDAPHKLFYTDGKGGIKSQYDFPNGNDHALDSAVIDYDNDGDLDVFVVSEGGYDKNLFINNGDSTFSISLPWPNPGDNLTTVSAADFDGDNDIDFYIYDSNLGFVRLYKNDGTGSLSATWLENPITDITDTGIADFDKDGDIDVIEVSFNDKIIVRLNNGDGTFIQSWTSVNNHSGQCVAVGDLDGDGDIDAYVGNQNSYNQILLNNGNGIFSEKDHIESVNVNSADVVIGDLDLDGDLDIVSGDSAALRIYRNNGSGSYTDMLEYGAWSNTKSLSVGQIFK